MSFEQSIYQLSRIKSNPPSIVEVIISIFYSHLAKVWKWLLAAKFQYFPWHRANMETFGFYDHRSEDVKYVQRCNNFNSDVAQCSLFLINYQQIFINYFSIRILFWRWRRCLLLLWLWGGIQLLGPVSRKISCLEITELTTVDVFLL